VSFNIEPVVAVLRPGISVFVKAFKRVQGFKGSRFKGFREASYNRPASDCVTLTCRLVVS